MLYSKDYVKTKLQVLYKTTPTVHITVNLCKPSVQLTMVEARLVGLYEHIFQIEAQRNGRIDKYSIQYSDVMAGIVKIEELNRVTANPDDPTEWSKIFDRAEERR